MGHPEEASKAGQSGIVINHNHHHNHSHPHHYQYQHQNQYRNHNPHQIIITSKTIPTKTLKHDFHKGESYQSPSSSLK